MNRFEVQFMINKVCSAIGTCMQIKKSFMHDFAEDLDQRILGSWCTISCDLFVHRIKKILKDIDLKLFGGLETKISEFSIHIRQHRVPDHLLPGQTFLGKFLIEDIIPYSKIIKEGLMKNPSVFKLQSPTSQGRLNNSSIYRMNQSRSVQDDGNRDEYHGALDFQFFNLDHKLLEGDGILRPELRLRIQDKELNSAA